MRDEQFGAKITQSRPVDYRQNTEFTDSVMKSVQSGEILSKYVRTMSVNKKETFSMKLRKLPKYALVSIVVGTLALASGAAYASYQLLWPEPRVEVSAPTTSNSGRQEFAISFADCGKTGVGSRYELKKNATIDKDEVQKVVQAQCELNVLHDWAQSTFISRAERTMPSNDYTKPHTMVSIFPATVTYIKSQNNNSITFKGQDKYGQPQETLDITPKTRFIADGQDVKTGSLSLDKPIAYLIKETEHLVPEGRCDDQYCSLSSETVKSELIAVIELSQNFKYYNHPAWQSLTEIVNCNGNPDSECLTGNAASIKLYQDTNSNESKTDEFKEIAGVLDSISGSTLTLKSSSGERYTITPPIDVVTDFNMNRSADYNNKKVNIGDRIHVRYFEDADKHQRTITGSAVQSVDLQLEMISKGDALKIY